MVGTIGLCALLGACAFPAQVQRFGVEYNAALAEMNNEQTLLNILRAKDGMPTHFTSVSQFRGSINLTVGGSLNGQFRGEGLTQVAGTSGSTTSATTNSATTVASATPSTTTVSSLVTTPVSGTSASTTIAEGVDLFTPQVSGQIVSGTNFDVSVFDTQKFYQGITTAVPFSTVETLLHQGIDNRVLELMTITQVEFRLKDPIRNHAEGELVFEVVNDPTDPIAAAKFLKFVNCYRLDAGTIPGSTTNIVAVSRMTRGADGKPVPLAIDKVTVIDGQKFSLSDDPKTGETAAIGDDPKGDSDVFLTRVTPEKRVPRLSRRDPAKCVTASEVVKDYTLKSGVTIEIVRPILPPKEAIYLGNGMALLNVGGTLVEVDVTMDITFRSPEGMFRYLGAYLQYDNGAVISIDNAPLFSIAQGRSPDALAEASYRGKHYSLVNTGGMRNAQIFTLLQQLINLHKDASDRPTVIPVRAIP